MNEVKKPKMPPPNFYGSLQGIDETQARAAALEKEVETLISSARNISSKIADLKKLVAEQKILSVNAAIEAGRAGDMGKGLKVVANQMGELADSSLEIYEMIQEDSSTIHTSAEHLKIRLSADIASAVEKSE